VSDAEGQRMSYNDITEDSIEFYPCQCGGHITDNDNGVWCCDKCGLQLMEVTNDNM
jgi:ribosomal protein L37AE/L43A